MHAAAIREVGIGVIRLDARAADRQAHQPRGDAMPSLVKRDAPSELRVGERQLIVHHFRK